MVAEDPWARDKGQFIALSSSGSQSVIIFLTVPPEEHNEGHVTLARVGLQKKNPRLEEPSIVVFKQTCFLTQRETLPLSSRAVHFADILEKSLERGLSMLLLARHEEM